METETPAASSPGRSRTWLLVLFGVVVAAAVMMALRGSTGPPLQTSNAQTRTAQTTGEKPLDPAELDVRIESLDNQPPAPDKADRNPFRFQPKAPPPAPPVPPATKMPPQTPVETGPPPPAPPPPIPLKLMGITEALSVGKIAALTDCKYLEHGREGETVYGRYRIVKIGVESVVIEYTDGKGRTTLRIGQGCGGS